jgi:hypothetical protein
MRRAPRAREEEREGRGAVRELAAHFLERVIGIQAPERGRRAQRDPRARGVRECARHRTQAERLLAAPREPAGGEPRADEEGDAPSRRRGEWRDEEECRCGGEKRSLAAAGSAKERHQGIGAPDTIRTCDPCLRRAVL